MNASPRSIVLMIGFALLCSPLALATAETDSGFPAVLEAGFSLWQKGGGIDGVLNVWQKGGLLDGDRKVAVQASYLRSVSQVLGNYQSHERLQIQALGRNTKILYFAIQFERGAVYSRVLLYKTDKDWVVQNMDFSTRPEALMPWLAFEGDKSTP
jgi:hypothetical protein